MFAICSSLIYLVLWNNFNKKYYYDLLLLLITLFLLFLYDRTSGASAIDAAAVVLTL